MAWGTTQLKELDERDLRRLAEAFEVPAIGSLQVMITESFLKVGRIRLSRATARLVGSILQLFIKRRTDQPADFVSKTSFEVFTPGE